MKKNRNWRVETLNKDIIKEIDKELEYLKKSDCYRSLKEITSPNSSYIFLNNRKVLNFCSNNYLGLTTHPEVIAHSIKVLNEYGTGGGASRLISGNLSPYILMEQELAKFLNTESALIFSSGYQANIGVITSLVGKNDAIFCDRLCHASIIDGVLLSHAKLFRYPHKNYKILEDLLSVNTSKFNRKLIITESIFSMDGDIAQLFQIAEISKKYNAFLLIDEAHAFGVAGKEGRGVHELFDLKLDNYTLFMGTFGKALASSGAFVACSQKIREYLINKARSFIFTTAPSPASIGAAYKSLEIIRKYPEMRKDLLLKAQYFRNELKLKGFNCMESESQIIPLLIGDIKKTMLFSKNLLEDDIYIHGIRPPTVPPNTARLRISLISTHTQDGLDVCLKSICKIGKKLGII